MLFPAAVFFIIGVNYIIKESYYSIYLIGVFGAGVLLCYIAFQPESVGIEVEAGYLNANWIGFYEILGSLFIGFMGAISFYWGFKTWRNAPFLIKKEALLFLAGVIIDGPITLILYLFYYLNPIFILYAYATTGLGSLMFCIAMVNEPKLLYILPFTVYRISVKDREGDPLFDYDWTLSSVHETLFTGFLNAVQLMSEDIMNVGGLLDIHLENGILILNESDVITVGLVSSKSSKLLRGLVLGFTNDFQMKFKKELFESCKEREKYDTAYELIEKYFSNFPYKIITSRKQPLLLTGKFAHIPAETVEKFKEIFADEKEYETILSEMQKSPLYINADFFSLYNEMQSEKELLNREKLKLLPD
jgi:hypothetical protein